jgi:hypothetical protein
MGEVTLARSARNSFQLDIIEYAARSGVLV